MDRVDSDTGIRLKGRVKWFDPAKGYGFVVPEEVDGMELHEDIMLHVTCLRAFGETMADEGARIECEIVHRERGWQVLNITIMDRPRAAVARETAAAVVFEPVIVKWFDMKRGFGFVNPLDGGEDIFLHISVARKADFDRLDTGMRLDAVLGEGQKGRNVVLLKKV